MLTPYHAKYFAYELTRQGGSGVERLSRSLFDACVDLNPHQIEAALFALRSPISKGVLLADEVGLGKTIEAGIVLCQYWAENKRRLLIVCPASLRKQWSLELQEKFNLPSVIIDARAYRQAAKNGTVNPFEAPSVVITSINFASRNADKIRLTDWDLVVVDEAHKLRNAYRPSNKMGQNIRWALEDHKKILLTATPLQNSLLELYGLSTIIDEFIFGDETSFRAQYANIGTDVAELRNRLNTFCKRTLRSQVLEYVRYTERRLITRPFKPSDNEHRLYEAVSAFLQREDTYAIPTNQRHLTILILHKLLASSSHAVAATLETMRQRLCAIREGLTTEDDVAEHIITDEDIEDELLEEFITGEEPQTEPEGDDQSAGIDRRKLDAEIRELERYASWANSIDIDTKSQALLKALEIGFAELDSMGAEKKAVIFTESRRTQAYLKKFLDANGYADSVITFNGTNTDQQSRVIYDRWVRTNQESGRVTGSRPVDTRTALIEYFRDHASIMIATEAAAEGVNLQFCSLVLNYDLPWNPQRIEQRIGRCHRYGQKFDVVVINFLNERNAADRRVYELLDEKFHLFRGVFGASDDVLGSIESGVDFEKRILSIYQQCRGSEEIEEAFNNLQSAMDDSIQSRMAETRQMLLEHFDEDVHTRLRVNLDGTRQRLDQMGKRFWLLTKHIIDTHARFDDDNYSFDLVNTPIDEAEPGRYHLISKTERNIPSHFLYRLSHPLGEHVIAAAKETACPSATVTFDVSDHPTKISLVERLRGLAGWLCLQRLLITSFEREEYLLFSGITDEGRSLNQETCEKLFHCHATVDGGIMMPGPDSDRLTAEADRHVKAMVAHSLETNNRLFNEARERLEKWADDMVVAAEKELKDIKNQIKNNNRQARLAETIEEQHQVQARIRDFEAKKRRQRRRIFDIEDEIIEKRDSLISALEKRMSQQTTLEPLFTIRWSVV